MSLQGIMSALPPSFTSPNGANSFEAAAYQQQNNSTTSPQGFHHQSTASYSPQQQQLLAMQMLLKQAGVSPQAFQRGGASHLLDGATGLHNNSDAKTALIAQLAREQLLAQQHVTLNRGGAALSGSVLHERFPSPRLGAHTPTGNGMQQFNNNMMSPKLPFQASSGGLSELLNSTSHLSHLAANSRLSPPQQGMHSPQSIASSLAAIAQMKQQQQLLQLASEQQQQHLEAQYALGLYGNQLGAAQDHVFSRKRFHDVSSEKPAGRRKRYRYQCQHEGCTKTAKGGGFCIGHGGGKRCVLEHCDKVARFAGSLCHIHRNAPVDKENSSSKQSNSEEPEQESNKTTVARVDDATENTTSKIQEPVENVVDDDKESTTAAVDAKVKPGNESEDITSADTVEARKE